MKKNYFMLAAATMMFAACAETDLVNEVNMEEAPKAIEFESFANKTTRAEIASLTDLQTVGFQVWGYKYPKNEDIIWEDVYSEAEEGKESELVTKKSETIFNGVNATYSTTWGHDGTPQYWNDAYKYNFYAVAPKNPETDASYSIDKGNIKITGVKSNKSDNSFDYLIAAPVTEKNGSDKGIVNFNFSHIMSKVSFKLKAGVNENITVTSLKMSGWNKYSGTFTQNADPEWNIENTTIDGSVYLVGAADEAVDKTITLTTNAPENAVQDAYIMVPQTITNLTFTISYDIIRGDVRETFTDQVGTIASTEWTKNTHTTYTITVSPAEIKFDIAANPNFGWGSTPEVPTPIQ